MATPLQPLYPPRRLEAWPFVLAALVHGVVATALLMPAGTRTSPTSPAGREPEMVFYRLAPFPEGNSSMFMASAHNSPAPPPGQDHLPDPGAAPGADSPAPSTGTGVSDSELASILARDREALRAEINNMSQVASAAPLPSVEVPLPRSTGSGNASSSKGPEGAIRELNLEGFSQKITDEIMARYHLKVVTQHIAGGRRGQTFLSTASRGPTERYFGGMSVPEGLYEVFQLNRDTVALMSRLEEEALKKQGLEPLQSRVIRIVFGIVKTGEDQYELGVKSLEAEKVVP